MKDLIKIIRTLYPVSDEAIELLARHTTLKSVHKGKYLITEGKINSHFYLVKKGMLRLFHFDEIEEKEKTIYFALSGNGITSLHSYIASKPAMFNVEALVDSELFEISQEDMERIFSESNDLANWGRMLAFEEMHALECCYAYVGTGNAFSRYKSFIERRPLNIIRQIPLKYIASYLGMTPQTLSKMRRRLANK